MQLINRFGDVLLAMLETIVSIVCPWTLDDERDYGP
jgi:hypothetical protein